MSAASGPCQDSREERSGALKWAILNAVFSASTAIAVRNVDVEDRDGECVVVSATCDALAADGSYLMILDQQGVASYAASFKGLLSFNDGAASCASVRQFQASDGVVRILFEG